MNEYLIFPQPLLTKIGILDTCGVNNLHGMPGVYSGLLSVLFAALATTDNYGTDELGTVFGAMKNVRILIIRAINETKLRVAPKIPQVPNNEHQSK